MRSHVGRAFFTIGLWCLAGHCCHAQNQERPEFPRLAELEARYRKQADELERNKLAALASLARRARGAEAEAAYREAFNLAVARGLYTEAERPAREYLAREGGQAESHALAAAITLIARAGRGEYDQSLSDLEEFLRRRAAAQIPDDRRLPPTLAFAVGEAYLQRLVQGGRYDIARRVCQLAASNHPDPTVKAYFQRREARLDMVGKPAPDIEGKDVDGRAVLLANFKGKVVLIDFWATWCPPCMAAFPSLRQLAREYKEQGFVILGVNLDELAHQTSGQPAAKFGTALADVRWCLVTQRAGWPNLVGAGAEAAAKAYGVEDIPASFLVGRDGTVIQVEQRGQALARAVAEALGKPGS